MVIIVKKQDLDRVGDLLEPDEVFPHVQADTRACPKPKHTFQGNVIKMFSPRYLVFSEQGCTCVTCGLEGKYFAIERHKNPGTGPYHLNLYGVDDEGDEVLMTVDHIVPASHGGPRTINNLQPMCKVCNEIKGDKV
jgi:5-methylcytosine-specific restriction endonuclease McrA